MPSLSAPGWQHLTMHPLRGPVAGENAGMRALTWLPGSIPSPSSNAIHVGDFQLRAYGLMIALGVLAAVAIARRRWVAWGGNADEITAAATWGVPAGLLGARLYHVATDYHRFEGRWLDALKVWE